MDKLKMAISNERAAYNGLVKSLANYNVASLLLARMPTRENAQLIVQAAVLVARGRRLVQGSRLITEAIYNDIEAQNVQAITAVSLLQISALASKIRASGDYEDHLEYDADMLAHRYNLTIEGGNILESMLQNVS